MNYSKTINCIPFVGEDRRISMATKEEVKKSEIDTRLYIASLENTKDIVEYLNYYKLLSTFSDRWVLSNSSVNSRYITLLELGFVPLYIPPTFLFDKNIEFRWLLKIKELEIRFMQHKPIRFDGSYVDSDFEDIWVSKLDIARIMNVPVEKVRVIDFIKEELIC